MKIFVWRHNRRLHSSSMINEPVINQALYTDAVLVVQAETIEEAYRLIGEQHAEWVIDQLKQLEPKIIDGKQIGIIFADIRGE